MTCAVVVTGAASAPAEAAPPARFSAADLRRSSRLCRMALPAIEAALAQAALAGRTDLGLVVGSGLGNLDDAATFLDEVHEGGGPGSPQRFTRSLLSSLGGELAILYGLRSWSLTVTQGMRSGEAALRLAALAVSAGRCPACLCVAADAACEALRVALRELHTDAAVGEGAAALVVESESHARARGARILARLHGVDLAAAGQPVADGLGVHGSVGLVRAALALRDGGAPPPGIHWEP